MVDFKKFMTPEQLAAYNVRADWHKAEVEKVKNMTPATLALAVEYCMTQAQAPQHYQPGTPVYDAQLWYIYLPELLRRLRQ